MVFDRGEKCQTHLQSPRSPERLFLLWILWIQDNIRKYLARNPKRRSQANNLMSFAYKIISSYSNPRSTPRGNEILTCARKTWILW